MGVNWGEEDPRVYPVASRRRKITLPVRKCLGLVGGDDRVAMNSRRVADESLTQPPSSSLTRRFDKLVQQYTDVTNN